LATADSAAAGAEAGVDAEAGVAVAAAGDSSFLMGVLQPAKVTKKAEIRAAERKFCWVVKREILGKKEAVRTRGLDDFLESFRPIFLFWKHILQNILSVISLNGPLIPGLISTFNAQSG
jgi:hypothetical protein